MDISLNHSDDSCRCCQKNGNLISIFEEAIDDMEINKVLTEIVPVQITKNDGFSQLICIDCKNEINKFYNFRLMCIATDENLRNQRRPVSRNNEHDYSAWKIDEYDMDLSEYLIEEPPLKDDDDAVSLLIENRSTSNSHHTALQFFDETQNFDVSSKKKGRKTYSCPICSKLWITPSKLKRHLSSHKNNLKEDTPQPSPEQTQCPICNCLLDSPQKLTQHMSETHVKIDKKELINSNKLTCNVRGTEENSPTKLKTHMLNRHLKKKKKKIAQHKCQYCYKLCVTPSKLERHLRVHTKAKKPPCEKRPPGPRRHECLHCGKKFETPSKLLRHTSTVHKDVKSSSEIALEISTVTSILGD